MLLLQKIYYKLALWDCILSGFLPASFPELQICAEVLQNLS
ncbi:MAG: hypothetical protein PHG79_03115 [Methanosarcina sp.]|jgi:hypothetical protein|nr:hypothetical protein [Methanosarcina sp.]MDD3873668.1 hypothetical protein [Methanosarcina sp.]MDD4522252.1 hypothetical protein [Methanosarcina sp.]